LDVLVSILFYFSLSHLGCDLFNATNALKSLIDQSEERILQIDQLKKCFEALVVSSGS